MTAHKHKDVIIAYANGNLIQVKSPYSPLWFDCEGTPQWCTENEYRIKPEPKPDYSKFIGLYSDNYKIIHGADGVWSSGIEYVSDAHSKYTHLLLCNKLELVFDGETNELKEVKIHSKE